MSEARQLRDLAERLCAVATGTEDEILTVLAVPVVPPPLGARSCHVRSGVLSRASVRLEFATPVFTREELDAALGASHPLRSTVPTGSSTLGYRVTMDGAPAMVSVYASFLGKPEPTAAASSVLLRIDPARLAAYPAG